MHRDLNDIIPPSRRRNLSPDGQGPSMDMRPRMDMQPPTYTAQPSPAPLAATPPPPAPPPLTPAPAPYRAPKKFPLATALIALVVIALCGGVLYAFSGAKVVVVPASSNATITSDLSATAGQGDLPFQIVTVEKTATASVPAESTVTATDPATGKITITNKQTSAQALIKNTRFQSASGLVFRIHDSVSIPAGGSVQAPVYADEAGDKYNIAATTFTVPGLKGGKAYDLVTAKSDAPMTGGFSGTRPSVAQATKDKQYADIQGKLTTELAKDLAAKMPAGYVLVPGASFTSFVPVPDTAGASGTVTLAETGTVQAVVFPMDALARTIAFKSVGTYGGQPVTLASVDKLLVKPAQPTLAPDATQFDFNLTGSATVVWTVDPTKIAAAVAGKTRNSAEISLQSFPEVDKATLILRPFWASKFPGEPTKIKVTVSSPAAPK